jgi:DNA-directed RNA polymerase subunit RPC12/RpoP
MAISFPCGSCGHQYSVNESLAGRSTKCARCGNRLTVPGGEKPTVVNADVSLNFSDVPTTDKARPYRGQPTNYPKIILIVLILLFIPLFVIDAGSAAGLAIWFTAFVGGGYGLGLLLGRETAGMIYGLLLGPIGLLILLLLVATDKNATAKIAGRKCQDCQGRVPQHAKRCKHCGVVLADV